MEFIGYVICAFLAFAIGVLAESKSIKTIGSLIVDRTKKDEPPYLYLQLDDPDWYKTLEGSSQTIFRVRFKD